MTMPICGSQWRCDEVVGILYVPCENIATGYLVAGGDFDVVQIPVCDSCAVAVELTTDPWPLRTPDGRIIGLKKM